MNNISKNRKKEISLVLGSGAARGMAHIGVIHYLQEHNYEIKYISGSSIGALIGGIFAAGKLNLYTEWVTALKRKNIIRLLDISFSKKSIFKGEKIIGVLNEMIGDHNIEELPIGFTAVATDLLKQKEIWFSKGPLFEAIRASMAVPMIFSPVTVSGSILVDGGIINPIPIAPTLNDNTELTIAVALNGPPEAFISTIEEESIENEDTGKNKYQIAIEKFIDGLLLKNDESSRDDANLFDLVTKSMDTMQTTVSRFKLAANRPDVVIEVPRNICSWFDFDRANELIEFGYTRASETLDKFDKSSGIKKY